MRNRKVIVSFALVFAAVFALFYYVLFQLLSAKGAGADAFSEEHRQAVANIDIGGGTSNIALFQKGNLKGTSCLDIGGRLIKIENGRISYIFPKIQKLAEAHGIHIAVGDRAEEAVLYKICEYMADQLAMAIHAREADSLHAGLYTNDGKPLTSEPKIDAITYSGGVASCYYNGEPANVFEYGDVGDLLA